MPLPEGGGDRNAIPLYNIPNAHVVHHFIPAMPLRVSALRALGAYHNVFSIESFMDELAARRAPIRSNSGCKHLRTRAPRGHRKAAQGFGWKRPTSRRTAAAAASPSRATRISRPIAPSRSRSRSTARPAVPRLVRVVAAVDSGQVVNPDGIRNQIEGAHRAVDELDAV